MGLTGLIGILGVIMFDGPRITETLVLVVSALALAISALRLRTVMRHSAAQRYKRYHRPLAGPRPGARLG